MKKLLRHLQLIFRGLKVLHKLSPYNMAAKVFRSLIDGVKPYVNLYLSAAIVDAMIAGKAVGTIGVLVLVTIGANGILTICSHVMSTVNYVKWNQFYPRYNMSVGQKAMSLEYSAIEDPQTHRMIKNIDDAMKISNYGLIKLHSRIPLFFQHFFSLLCSLAFTVSLMAQKGDKCDSVLMRFMNSGMADLLLVAAVLTVCLVCMLGNARISTRSYSLLGQLSKWNRVFDYYLNQYLEGHKAGKDIRLYQQNDLILEEVQEFGERSEGIVKKLNDVICKNQILMAAITFLLTFYTYSYVGIKAMAGAFAVGSIIKYSGAILQFSDAVSGMMDAASQLWANHPYLERYFAFVDQPSAGQQENRGHAAECMDREKDRIDSPVSIVLEFQNVSFRYPHTDYDVLRNVNLQIKAGDRIAVVGQNGSGKTTLIKLLCRLYDPTEGKIMLNGKDIREYEYQEYQSLLGVVFQDFCLFGFSLGQNVAAKKQYDEEKVTECLRKAGFAGRLATLPLGTETVLYKDFHENGVEISGGEAQKIALARALYRDARLIILDEPTAALDPVAEAEVYETFNEMIDDRTAIYISHRLSSCRFCKRILVLDKGCVIQQGTHEELVEEKQGKYFELWQAQAQYYRDE